MSVKLCGGRKCCPTIEKEDGKYVIKDDFGGKVTLTEAQLNEIPTAKKQVDKNEG